MKKILIVDYDQNCLTSIQGVLATQGYRVITAPDGQAGWDKYIKEDPDLVLMEAMLPKVHGFELCQRITSERNSQAKVFIMTGVYKDRVYRTEALRTYGASEYFEKPLKMTELLASVEAVLGRPEPPADEAPAEVPAAMSAKPAMAESSATTRSTLSTESSATTRPAERAELRKREKAKSDDSLFSLPEDLDRLAREIPKARKPAPAAATGPAAPEPSNGSRFDALADDLLRSVMTEAKPLKPAAPKHGPGNGNGNGKAEIDQVLASALAGLDLDKEKVKVPKTAPLPPPPAPTPPTPTTATGSPTPPVLEKPAPVPPPVVLKPKPVPIPAPPVPPVPPVAAPPAPAPKPAPADMKNTLTPGDPGSDVSPFFTPEKPKPAPPVMKPVAPSATGSPATSGSTPVVKPAKPAEKPFKVPNPIVETARPVPPATPTAAAAPASPATSAKTGSTASSKTERRPEPKPEPTPLELAQKDINPTVGGDIFEGFHATEEKASGGFPKIIPIAIGVVALAAVGFILLRPKSHAPAPVMTRETAQTQTPAQPTNDLSSQPSGADPSTTAGTNPTSSPGPNTSSGSPAAPKTEPKPAPVKQKTQVQPKAKPADNASSGIDAILPILPASSELAPPAGQPGTAPGASRSETAQPKTEDPAAKPAAEPPPATNSGGVTAENPEASAAGAVGTPIVAPVKEGDLVELSSVTEPPKLVKSADPIYPPTAQRLGVSGSITVNALIDEKGNVIDTGILKGIQDDKGLGRAAETAVRKWKFQPARKNGVAVKVWKSFVIAFKADQNPANRME